jgi:hypothetical protein
MHQGLKRGAIDATSEGMSLVIELTTHCSEPPFSCDTVISQSSGEQMLVFPWKFVVTRAIGDWRSGHCPASPRR